MLRHAGRHEWMGELHEDGRAPSQEHDHLAVDLPDYLTTGFARGPLVLLRKNGTHVLSMGRTYR